MKLQTKEVMKLNGKEILEYQVTNDKGFRVDVITLGATVTGIYAPDKKGAFENVVLKYKDYNEYKVNCEFIGSIIGRTSGRIGEGAFILEGKEYNLNKNNNGNTLHGGNLGFNLKIWDCEPIIGEEEVKLIFTYISKDGEENYPGNLQAKVIYSINNDNTIKLNYEGKSDKTTLVNMTNHSYFNLSGEVKRNILRHNLWIDSEKIVETDGELIPTGALLQVENTPFDFRRTKEIGKDIDEQHSQLEAGGGYDHPWVLNCGSGPKVDIHEEECGRGMRIYTDCSHVVVYSMNFSQKKELSSGRKAENRDAICFETQSSPIGRGNTFIEESILEAGRVYNRETVFEFYVK